jgi:signal peptidase I
LVRHVAWWSVRIVVVLGTLALVGLAAAQYSGGVKELTVLSGSMSPAFDSGDVVVATRVPCGDLRIGDVIVYAAPTPTPVVLSHRVVAVRPDGNGVLVRTRGDANPVDDPWNTRLPAGSVWRVRYVIPRVGGVLGWLQDGPARPFILLGCPALMILWLLARFRPPAGYGAGAQAGLRSWAYQGRRCRRARVG